MPETVQTQSQNSNVQYDPSQLQQQAWGGLWGAAAGTIWPDGNFAQAPQFGKPLSAEAGQASQDWWNNVHSMQTPDYGGVRDSNLNLQNQVHDSMQNPNDIRMQSNYQNTQFQVNPNNFQDPFAGYNGGGPGMQIQAPGGVGGTADAYRTSVDQVRAPQGVQADRISGLPQISGPNLQNYQMAGPERVSAPGGLNSFQLNAPQQVQAGTVGTQSFTAPGTSQQFMSPYMQDVVDTQKDQAQRDYDEQLTGLHSQAVKAGAFGGSRQAVVDAEANRDLQNRMKDIQATGTQQAFQQAQQQFNQEQGLGQGAQQFNVQTGLQAGLANQGAGMQTSLANQQAALAAQGLGTTTGLQAALANQQAGLTAGGQNLQALLQTQGLGATLGQQAQQSNQQMAYQQQLANQQAGLQAGMFNNTQDLSAQQMNQGANLQAGLNATNLGFQGAMGNAQMGMQAQLANQQAQQAQYQRQFGAMGQQGGWGMQAGLNTQNLGMQAQQNQMANNQFGAGLDFQSQQAQQAARQSAINANQNAFGMSAGLQNNQANYLNTGFQNQAQQAGIQQGAAVNQQGFDQAARDREYQDWMRQQNYPMQMISWGANIASQFPQQGGVQSSQQGVNRTQTPNPSPWNTVAGVASTAIGAGMKAAGVAEGGLIQDGGVADSDAYPTTAGLDLAYTA